MPLPKMYFRPLKTEAKTPNKEDLAKLQEQLTTMKLEMASMQQQHQDEMLAVRNELKTVVVCLQTLTEKIEGLSPPLPFPRKAELKRDASRSYSISPSHR